MVSAEKLTRKFALLDGFLTILVGMQKTSSDAFEKDKILVGSAKYYLQVSIECCLDIANHIIAAEHYRIPNDYADSFKVLEEQKVVEPEHALKLRQMAKFRNRLVHLYGEINDAFVYDFIRDGLEDILLFKAVIAKRYLP